MFVPLFIVAFVILVLFFVWMNAGVVTSEIVRLRWGWLLLWAAIGAVLFASVGSMLWSGGVAVWEFVSGTPAPAPPTARGPA